MEQKNTSAHCWDVAEGDITIRIDDRGRQFVEQAGVCREDAAPVLCGHTDCCAVVIENDTRREVWAVLGAPEKELHIDLSDRRRAAVTVTGSGPAKIILNGRVFLHSGMNHAGLEKGEEVALLTLDKGENGGSLEAWGGRFGAGIGSKKQEYAAHIRICGGNILARGSSEGAGIGGGEIGMAKDITITGGTVEAIGNDAAGIGGGNFGAGCDILITGGDVTARCDGEDCAGIGGEHTSENICITGGTVRAFGGDNGAGIGGGEWGGAKNITITGGRVYALGGKRGAGIGGGVHNVGQKILISGGEVTAKSKFGGAGIGGGVGAAHGAVDITITGTARVQVSRSSGIPDKYLVCGRGACIGNGGTDWWQEPDAMEFSDGAEMEPDTRNLTGFIQWLDEDGTVLKTVGNPE